MLISLTLGYFGIRLPKTVEEALRIDTDTNYMFWRDAIAKEMKNVRPAFEVLEKDAKLPPGYKEIFCHMVFDVKMDFTRKARFVAEGHVTDPPSKNFLFSCHIKGKCTYCLCDCSIE